MKISHDGKRVTFKTEPEELFEAEKSGTKPNTVRILDIDEYHQLRKRNPKKIIIQYKQEIFSRTITNIHVTEGVFGKVIVVISWTNEEHHHAPALIVGPHSVPVEPGDHNMGLGPDMKIPSIPPICKCTNCIKSIQEEGDRRLTAVTANEPDELVPILLPRTLIEALGRHRQGRSHAEFIRELFEMYLDTLGYERGPMHD